MRRQRSFSGGGQQTNRIQSKTETKTKAERLVPAWRCQARLVSGRSVGRSVGPLGMLHRSASPASLLSKPYQNDRRPLGRQQHLRTRLLEAIGGAATGSGYDCVCRNSYKQSPPTICPWERRIGGFFLLFLVCRSAAPPRATGLHLHAESDFNEIQIRPQSPDPKTTLEDSRQEHQYTWTKIGRPLRTVDSKVTN